MHKKNAALSEDTKTMLFSVIIIIVMALFMFCAPSEIKHVPCIELVEVTDGNDLVTRTFQLHS